MKIYEFCPFFNENRIAELKVKENAYWVDELHIVEANKTFSYGDKPYNFIHSYDKNSVIYHKLDAEKIFRKPLGHQLYFNPQTCNQKNFDKWYWRLLSYNSAFQNEAAQRNMCADFLRSLVQDDDIIILSDLDEIIDSRFADRIITEVKRRQIITVKLNYSVCFLNLFCASNHGAPQFSYRLYVMTGRFFKSMPFTSDYLRKKGIAEALYEEVYCLEEPAGFHHSWLDYKKNAYSKLTAFASNVKDKEIINEDYIEKCLREKNLSYLNADLIIDNDKNFLRALKDIDTTDLWC